MTVVLALVAAVGVLTHQAITRSQSIDKVRDEIATLDTAAARLDLALLEVAAAERGYVAPGQGVPFWATRVDAALVDARGALGSMQASATDAGAVSRLASAMSRLDSLADMDARARAFASNGQREMASDLIFADGYEIVAAARTETSEGVALQRAAAAAPLALDRRVQLGSIAGIAALGAMALLLTLRRQKLPEPLVTSLDSFGFSDITRTAPAQPRVPDDAVGAALDASLAGLDAIGTDGAIDGAPGDATIATVATVIEGAAPTPAPVPATIPPIDFSAAADVCVDLARLLDMRDLQALLARTATVLEADGLIVWVMDPASEALAPALTHGYAPNLVARLGSLPMNADNATASAWREKRAQIVDGNEKGAGAIAVPMLTADGTMGVLSVELKNGRERAAEVQALARIVAAQLATVVAPPASDARRAAEA